MTKQSVLQIMTELRDSAFLSKEVFTLQEVCTYTGYEKSYVHKLCSRREIPYYHSPSGKAVFFDKTEIIAWMKMCPVKSKHDINNEVDLLTQILGKENM